MTVPGPVTQLKAVLSLALSVGLISFLPVLVRQAFYHHPALAINVLIVIIYFLYRLWRHHGGEIRVVLFHAVIWLIQSAIYFKNEYIIIDDTKSMKKQRNRKLVRCAMLFVMAQHCLTDNARFTWLHSFMAYKFFMDAVIFIKVDHARMRQQQQEEQQQQQQQRRQNTQQQHEPQQQNQQGHVGPATQVSIRPPPQDSSRTVQLAVLTVKILFAINIFFYQLISVNVFYVFVTFTYFLMTMSILSKPLTGALQHLQMDYFEGLEQYYAVGFLGILEILYAMLMMMWCLMNGQQFLMLAALYTNIYASSRDVISNAFSAAFTQWSLLAQFDKATREELNNLDDVCAICLCKMTTARKTRCKHYFHGHCLSRCAKEKPVCPICNKKLLG